MSYERQRTVKDGDEIIKDDDPLNREATKGPITHGEEIRDGTAKSTKINHHGETLVADNEVADLLRAILKQLKIMNMYNYLMTDEHITDKEIGD